MCIQARARGPLWASAFLSLTRAVDKLLGVVLDSKYGHWSSEIRQQAS